MSQRESEWIKVYVSTEPQRVEIVKAILEDNHISTHQVDRKDSTYPFMGEIEVYVQQRDAILARVIIENHQL